MRPHRGVLVSKVLLRIAGKWMHDTFQPSHGVCIIQHTFPKGHTVNRSVNRYPRKGGLDRFYCGAALCIKCVYRGVRIINRNAFIPEQSCGRRFSHAYGACQTKDDHSVASTSFRHRANEESISGRIPNHISKLKAACATSMLNPSSVFQPRIFRFAQHRFCRLAVGNIIEGPHLSFRKFKRLPGLAQAERVHNNIRLRHFGVSMIKASDIRLNVQMLYQFFRTGLSPITDRQRGPHIRQCQCHRTRGAPCSEQTDILTRNFNGGSIERFGKSRRIRILCQPATRFQTDQGICRANSPGNITRSFSELHCIFLVGRGDIQAKSLAILKRLKTFSKGPLRNVHGFIACINSVLADPRIVNDRRQGMTDRIADNTIKFRHDINTPRVRR